MISGNIFLTNEGMDLAGTEESKRNDVVRNFCDMRDDACRKWKDKFYADYNRNVNVVKLYSHLSDDPPYWSGVEPNVLQCLQQDFMNPPQNATWEQYCCKQEPRINGGFEYVGCPIEHYVYDCETHRAWHEEWNRCHTDCVEWESEIFPFKSLIIRRMKQELRGALELFADYNGEEKRLLSRFRRNELTDDEVVTAFHNLIVKHKNNEERAAYVEDIGEKICIENGYSREQDLERLEKSHGNKKVVKIFAIKRGGIYKFLSIDIKHGMFELCDDDGSHKGEKRFDGSPNAATESDHGLRCVAEWKRLYDR